MIRKQDILNRAAEWGLRPDVVEKDYVLGWLLVGITRHRETGPMWIFKGGTCLKKCFFETYRFSEDLDFSLLPNAPYTAAEIGAQLTAVARDVAGLSGIEFPGVPRIESLHNKQGQATFRARIEYRGPLSMPTSPKVLVDITRFERVEDDADRRPILHPYPDQLPDDISVSTYSLEELFAEKTRALSERTRPRDLYDVVQLTDNFADRIDFREARAIFRMKCTAKSLTTPTGTQLSSLVRGSAELAADWEHMLGHQLPALPPLQAILDRIGASCCMAGRRRMVTSRHSKWMKCWTCMSRRKPSNRATRSSSPASSKRRRNTVVLDRKGRRSDLDPSGPPPTVET